MFSQSRDSLDDEFGRPVESIMRCEDFKSNFARRLSNRYISRSPVSGTRQDNVLKLRPPADKQEILNNVDSQNKVSAQRPPRRRAARGIAL
ncbi:jg24366 [Pararge aegeria aegeria]|uniref:Jg24366 protein n=1 Tax=Pararge aegeria aegeria TaxID=348720 RepID=A0A8S4QW89_9NEOP|nr:jg24366 [Pararge aegeria aegeria]